MKVMIAVLAASVLLASFLIYFIDRFAITHKLAPLASGSAFLLFCLVMLFVGVGALLLLAVSCEISHHHHQAKVAPKPRSVSDTHGEFFSIVSHQMRSPLAAIRWLSEVLESETKNELTIQQRGYLQDIHEESQRMIRLLNSLMSMTRLEARHAATKPETVKIESLIQSLVKELRGKHTDTHAQIVVRKPAKALPAVTTDRVLYMQALENILKNAIRYSKPGRSRVEIKSEADGKGNVVVSVKDQGIGIPAQSQGRVFEKFYRAPNAVRAQTEGNGLGLYIAKMIIDLLGGSIWFESEEGKGSTFFVRIPVKK